MVSQEHEVVTRLFQNAPSLAALLLEEVLGLETPSHTGARLESGDLTECGPIEFKADAVVTLRHGDGAAMAVVVEVQRGRDDEKHWSRPYYVGSVRARLRCPTVLLVLCPVRNRVGWCRRPIELGHPDLVLRPLVVGPQEVPLVTDAALAAREPELAVLSTIVHAEEATTDVVDALCTGLAKIDRDRAQSYTGLVFSLLSGAARIHLEDLVATDTFDYMDELKSALIERYRGEWEARGEARGEARSVLMVLSARGVPVPEGVRERVLSCTDPDLLEVGVRRAATADTAEELFD